MKLYEQLAQQLSDRIEGGYYQTGDKLPSIRQMSIAHQVSVSTVQEAYRLLEENRLAEVRPKSGYYVKNRHTVPTLPNISRPSQKPVEVSKWENILQLLHSHQTDGNLAFGKGVPDVNVGTLKPLTKLISEISRRSDVIKLAYDSLQGSEALRHQIVRLMVDSGCQLHYDDIVLTTGCQEALSCSMRAITSIGDIIAIESPSHYGFTQAIQALGLKALEIPTHPETGISLDALEMALEQWPIKALQVTPICNNPLGYTMPDNNKKRLVALANQYDIAIIEDDIHGDLTYSYPRPRTIKSFDTEGRVLFCSSFSKSISPAFRTGWCAPGRYLEKVKHMKYVSTAGGSILLPRTIAEFIAQGYYERHIRKMRAQYLNSRDHMLEWTHRYFPEGTRMSYPQGGFLLWVEFPQKIDTVALNNRLAQHHISVAPGVLFTVSKKYQHCIRLNYTHKASEEIRHALEMIGVEAKKMCEDCNSA